MEGKILIISGPSGCGKTSILKEVFKQIDNYYFSISTTTREIRDGEKDGIDYYFVSKEEFEKDIKNNNFLEWAKVHNNYYGTSLKPVKKALEEGKLVIFDIDVQGHQIIREKLSDIVTSVFITTPNIKELKNRLYKRGSDKEDIITRRINNSQKEIKYLNEYDFLIVNDKLDEAIDKLLNIIKIIDIKTSSINIENFINNWLKA